MNFYQELNVNYEIFIQRYKLAQVAIEEKKLFLMGVNWAG